MIFFGVSGNTTPNILVLSHSSTCTDPSVLQFSLYKENFERNHSDTQYNPDTRCLCLLAVQPDADDIYKDESKCVSSDAVYPHSQTWINGFIVSTCCEIKLPDRFQRITFLSYFILTRISAVCLSILYTDCIKWRAYRQNSLSVSSSVSIFYLWNSRKDFE
jgi:hypothetical protein